MSITTITMEDASGEFTISPISFETHGIIGIFQDVVFDLRATNES
ncbi:hypothetical protein LCGC14_2728630, partial [marine sediment metagenome]